MEKPVRLETNASTLASEILAPPTQVSIKTAITNRMRTALSITSASLPLADSVTAKPAQATGFAPIRASLMGANQSSAPVIRAILETMTIA